MNIIQELKPLLYKDYVPKLLSYRLAYIPMSEARGFTLAFGKFNLNIASILPLFISISSVPRQGYLS